MVGKIKIFDIRGACCLETAGLVKKLSELHSGEVLEVVMDKSMKEMAKKISRAGELRDYGNGR
jgi:TusA-related sulfurtransferase